VLGSWVTAFRSCSDVTVGSSDCRPYPTLPTSTRYGAFKAVRASVRAHTPGSNRLGPDTLSIQLVLGEVIGFCFAPEPTWKL
jgi:hypothetical protein